MDRKRVRKSELLFPELSYQLVGVLFDVHNTLGYGYQEKYYQKAIAASLKKIQIPFREQVLVEIKAGDEVIAKGYADFIIDERIILEVKSLLQKPSNISQ